MAPPNLPMIAIDQFRHILLLEDDTTFITEVDIKIGSCKSLYGSTKCCQFGLMGTSSSLLGHFVSLLSIKCIACVHYFLISPKYTTDPQQGHYFLIFPKHTTDRHVWTCLQLPHALCTLEYIANNEKAFFEKTQRTFAFHFMVKVEQASQEVSGTESYKLSLAGKTRNRIVR